jgi:hypothetical protein
MIDLYVTFENGVIEHVDFYEIGTKNVYSVNSFDRVMAQGQITIARLGRDNVRLRDVTFFVATTKTFSQLDKLDRLVASLARCWQVGSAERGILLYLCEYSRTRPYSLFDGIVHFSKAKAMFGQLEAFSNVMAALDMASQHICCEDELVWR